MAKNKNNRMLFPALLTLTPKGFLEEAPIIAWMATLDRPVVIFRFRGCRSLAGAGVFLDEQASTWTKSQKLIHVAGSGFFVNKRDKVRGCPAHFCVLRENAW